MRKKAKKAVLRPINKAARAWGDGLRRQLLRVVDRPTGQSSAADAGEAVFGLPPPGSGKSGWRSFGS
jgi:hypothetical protein